VIGLENSDDRREKLKRKKTVGNSCKGKDAMAKRYKAFQGV
jgi:hypothetical protein